MTLSVRKVIHCGEQFRRELLQCGLPVLAILSFTLELGRRQGFNGYGTERGCNVYVRGGCLLELQKTANDYLGGKERSNGWYKRNFSECFLVVIAQSAERYIATLRRLLT
ncbi:hypothetical protein CBR_g4738 [Chara braunii]|uniref:Uncharacterized protein n=1 Tax=Chara braunii TaxID=69332 RepID=A0A388KIN0_CHABU|nr:hypothetical protein CBR_g4738 [Chara braunii]|eukprot:GBG69911.1 hypothetical protein CBR_g4738 [Chara braunii]